MNLSRTKLNRSTIPILNSMAKCFIDETSDYQFQSHIPRILKPILEEIKELIGPKISENLENIQINPDLLSKDELINLLSEQYGSPDEIRSIIGRKNPSIEHLKQLYFNGNILAKLSEFYSNHNELHQALREKFGLLYSPHPSINQLKLLYDEQINKKPLFNKYEKRARLYYQFAKAAPQSVFNRLHPLVIWKICGSSIIAAIPNDKNPFLMEYSEETTWEDLCSHLQESGYYDDKWAEIPENEDEWMINSGKISLEYAQKLGTTRLKEIHSEVNTNQF